MYGIFSNDSLKDKCGSKVYNIFITVFITAVFYSYPGIKGPIKRVFSQDFGYNVRGQF